MKGGEEEGGGRGRGGWTEGKRRVKGGEEEGEGVLWTGGGQVRAVRKGEEERGMYLALCSLPMQ